MDIRLFRQFADRVMRDFHPHLSIRLRPREIHLLTLLQMEPDRPLFFYADHVGLERGSFTYMVDSLEDKRILERKSSSIDKRHKTIELTSKGRDLVHEAESALEEYMENFLSALSYEDQNHLKETYLFVEKILLDLPKPHPREMEEDE